MIQVTTTEAQKSLPALLAEAIAGNSVEIRADDGQTFRLVATAIQPPAKRPRKAGSCKGLIEMAPDFDAPLEDMREYME
jgi:antitoxin (DNA-binding transcriptional repressor) of toxin-antitoxin stability system